MFVPLTHDGAKGLIFNLVCPGNAMSVSHKRQLLLKNATVNRNLGFDDICNEKQVFIAVEGGDWPFILEVWVSDKCFSNVDSLCHKHLPTNQRSHVKCLG